MFGKTPKEITEFENQFEKTEKEVLLLIDANGVGGRRIGKEEYWVATARYIAVKENGVLNKKQGRLQQKGTQHNLHALQREIKENSIIRARVRQGENNQLLLVRLLSYIKKDSEMEILRQEQLRDVFYEHPYFGQMKLNKQVHWFEREMEWSTDKVRLNVNQDTPENIEKALTLAQQVFEQRAKWDSDTKAFAADMLLELKNDTWLDEDEEELTKEEFMGKLTLTDFSIKPNGDFEFWFDDGDTFWGHAIMVEGNIETGFDDANIHG